MIVHAATNSVILKLRDPSVVLNAIPRSRVIHHKGQAFTQVRFGLDEARVLRNLGILAPSPITAHYDWPRNTIAIPEPFPHQKDTASFFTLNRRCICLNGMGTGKTMAALWAADYLMRSGVIRKCLILTPKSTIHSVWVDSIHSHMLGRHRAAVFRGTKDECRRVLKSDARFIVTNHDTVRTRQDILAEQSDIDLWIIDEAAQGWTNQRNQRYTATKALLRPADWLWLMTGTPMPRAPTDAWPLAKLIGSKTAPKFFTHFKEDTMLQVTPHKAVPKEGAFEKAYAILQPGIRYRKEDCIKLPPITFQELSCEMTDEQSRAFQGMLKRLRAEVGTTEITAANAAVRLQKLLQIATGMVYDEAGAPVKLDVSPRLQLLEDLCESAANKVIVFVNFTSSLHRVAEHLRARWPVEVVNGATSVNERKRIFAAFQNEDAPRILVAHPETASHGLTLTRADTTIWYGPIYKLQTFEQANNRMDRPGQVNSMNVYMLSSTSIEQQVYQMLRSKGDAQATLLNMYKQLLTG